jgi:hypothetical protein
MALLGICQLVVTAIVVAAYPETAHLELEALNPEDVPIDLHHLDAAIDGEPGRGRIPDI